MRKSKTREAQATRWCLESVVDGGRSLERVPIASLPFRIGRLDGLELTLPFQSVSKRHAEIYDAKGDLMLRDLESTNGTFVNRKKIADAQLHDGDILHFAEFEFRLGRQSSEETPYLADGEDTERGTLALHRIELPQHFVGGTRQLADLLDRNLAKVVFQPIVALRRGTIEGCEVLGRGFHEELPSCPKELFRIAETMGRAAELSRLFRRKAIELAAASGRKLPLLFLNTHPAELGTPELIDSLQEMRKTAPGLDIAIEIHEGALAEPQVIAELKRELDGLGMRLALDDFGLGERILSLAEVPPHYLKFDISMVKDIVSAPASKRRLLAMLMAAAREVSAVPIAEGIETDTEAQVCTSAGFTLAQGFHFGKPVPLEEIRTP
jgi:EAL domain-containing protein (putative c-di-GMP-specific phosphodiesterase class I)